MSSRHTFVIDAIDVLMTKVSKIADLKPHQSVLLITQVLDTLFTNVELRDPSKLFLYPDETIIRFLTSCQSDLYDEIFNAIRDVDGLLTILDGVIEVNPGWAYRYLGSNLITIFKEGED